MAVPSAWPALLALAVVVLLSIGMLATDLIVEHRTAAETTKLVGDALRSVTLADHLRADAHALAATPDPAVAANVAEEIARDAALYEPLATYPGEHAEWTHLQGLLEGLQREQMNGGSGLDSVVSDIEASIDRIVQLNEREAADSVTIIRAVHRQAFAADAIAGAVTLVLAIIVATVLVRALRRQRFLIEARLETEQARRRELDAFAARVAHDLRGPLTPIRSYGELLCLGSGPPPREIGARIVDGTRRMVGIIDGLLTLSVSGRVGVGQTEIAPVIHQALDDLGPLPADSKIALAIADCRLCCPPDVLGRIVENLVSNAIKYRAPERPLELAITAARTGDAIEVAVADNGVGMDAAAMSRAFDPFFRVVSARAIPGHGLGLSIVKRTVDALGGACSIASKPGEGTRVTIRLPAAL
ncbi:MAG: HAMP domain-containing histidine kinase [Deltaproteobacteria bacterium]|nr:MAG: HAMP domain-containing histidine kinase [Deltaproteobacteria bacterium]